MAPDTALMEGRPSGSWVGRCGSFRPVRFGPWRRVSSGGWSSPGERFRKDFSIRQEAVLAPGPWCDAGRPSRVCFGHFGPRFRSSLPGWSRARPHATRSPAVNLNGTSPGGVLVRCRWGEASGRLPAILDECPRSSAKPHATTQFAPPSARARSAWNHVRARFCLLSSLPSEPLHLAFSGIHTEMRCRQRSGGRPLEYRARPSYPAAPVVRPATTSGAFLGGRRRSRCVFVRGCGRGSWTMRP
jgi:hypothetical protein